MSAEPPLVTFGIPAYRRGELLAAAVRSIAAVRASVPREILICDDGATGLGPAEEALAAREWGALAGGVPLRYRSNPAPLGAVGNWNRCLREAAGRWVTVLHEDDLLYPNFLDLVAAALAADGGVAALAVGVDSGGEPPAFPSAGRGRPAGPPGPEAAAATYFPRYFIKSSMTPFPGVLVRSEIALRLGGFAEKWGPLADYEFWYRLACAGPVRTVRARGAFYRVGPGQWTERAWVRMIRLTHLLRLRIAREQFGRQRRLGRWLARFFTYRNARSYAGRFPERPAPLRRALSLGRIPGAWLPSGWVWQAVKGMR